jgi:hypothetical protein
LKKWKLGNESRIFNDGWSSKYFFTECAGKVVCVREVFLLWRSVEEGIRMTTSMQTSLIYAWSTEYL